MPPATIFPDEELAILNSPEAVLAREQERDKWENINRDLIQQLIATRLKGHHYPPGASLSRTSLFALHSEEYRGFTVFWNPARIAYPHGAFTYVASTPRTVAALHAMPLDAWDAALAYLLANYDERVPVLRPIKFGGRYTAAHAPPDGTVLPNIRMWVSYEIHDWRKYAEFNRDADMERRLLFGAQHYAVKVIMDDNWVVLYREERLRNFCSTCSI